MEEKLVPSQKFSIRDLLRNENSSSTLTTQATINSHASLPNSESQTKGPRYSGPFRPLSNKNMPELSVLHENSADEDVIESLLPSMSEANENIENKENHSRDLNALSTSPSQGSIKKDNHEIIEMEEDIKSYASSKSEVFYDAQSELSSVETLTNDILTKNEVSTNLHPPLQRRRGRDESNFDVSFYNNVINSKKEIQTSDEKDSATLRKKNKPNRTVSFSNASRRWSQLRSANKISSNFSRKSKRQSSSSTSRDEVDHEGVQLRRKR